MKNSKLYSITRSLRFKLLICIMAVSIVPPMFIGYYYYHKQSILFEQEEAAQAADDLQFLLINLERQISEATRLSNWTMLNKTFAELFKLQPGEDQKLQIQSHQKSNAALQDQIRTIYVAKYVEALLLKGDNGISLQSRLEAGDLDADQFSQQQWFVRQLEGNGSVYWDDLIVNHVSRSQNKYIIPVVRPVITSSGKQLGWSYIGYNLDLIGDAFYKFKPGNGSSIFVLNGQGVCLYDSVNSEMAGKDLRNDPVVMQILDSGSGSISDQEDGSKYFFDSLTMNGWIVVEATTNDALVAQNKMLVKVYIIILLLSMAFTTLVGVLISRQMTRPMRRLTKKIRQVADGNFAVDPLLNGEDELGRLGKCVNDMSQSISNLMNLVASKEKEKHRLELTVLHSNINPHFVYNTLNTIRWVALIQNAPIISGAITSLGRLLRRTIASFDAKTTLGDELESLNDYLVLQDLRFAGKITTAIDIQEEALSGAEIPYLILQPIIENAIFHGIEPKQGNGTITLQAKRDGDDLVILVEDDGVGMDESKLQGINGGQKASGMTHIGINNVDQRLKLEYGQEYGLQICSRPLEYTRVQIRIPFIPTRGQEEIE